jgi:riboflavin kinase / FMN adenylyltransferase
MALTDSRPRFKSDSRPMTQTLLSLHAFVALTDPARLPPELDRPVVAIGNFDGMHVGHAALVEQAKKLGAERDTPPAILTFEPHPRLWFQPEKPLFRLTPPDLKAEAAATLGARGMVTLTFDAALAHLSAEEFVDALLVERLHVSGAVTGENFRFGQGRRGDAAFLKAAGERHGFAVDVVAPVQADGAPVSSSRIRTLLTEGDIAGANRLLGREWTARAEVAHGDKRGRLLGYPTANLILPKDTALKHGIYAVRATVEGVTRAAVASFGRRPTFDDGAPRLEVHVFDFAGNLYGKSMDVAFAGYIRPELKFDGVEPLIRQMDEDSRLARGMLAA